MTIVLQYGQSIRRTGEYVWISKISSRPIISGLEDNTNISSEYSLEQYYTNTFIFRLLESNFRSPVEAAQRLLFKMCFEG